MIRFEDEMGHSEYWYDSADVAKFFNIKDDATKRIIGRNKFLQMLRYNGVILKDSNQPTQVMINLGLMKWHMVKRRYYDYGMCIFSEKALGYIQNKLESGGWVVEFEKRIDRFEKQGLKLDDVC